MSRIPVDRAAAHAAGFRTKKRLGQHLLRDETVVEAALAALDVKPGEALLEIGPGLGAMTGRLLTLGVPLLAVEIDPSACRALAAKFGADPNFHLVEGDVLKTDLGVEAARCLEGRPFHVAANLPYYITTPVLARLLESRLPFGRMAVLTQWEVALRLAAKPGDDDWSALGALAHYYCGVTLLRKVLRGAFTPVPTVDSGLVLFERLPKPAVGVKDEALYFRLVRAGFGMRRKTLRKALLLSGLGLAPDVLGRALDACGIDGTRRGETLHLPEWAKLSDALGGPPAPVS